MKVPVFEILPSGEKETTYQYLGPDTNGLYAFVNEDGNPEWFARRTTPYSGWQLKRGSYFFEFVRSRHSNS